MRYISRTKHKNKKCIKEAYVQFQYILQHKHKHICFTYTSTILKFLLFELKREFFWLKYCYWTRLTAWKQNLHLHKYGHVSHWILITFLNHVLPQLWFTWLLKLWQLCKRIKLRLLWNKITYTILETSFRLKLQQLGNG